MQRIVSGFRQLAVGDEIAGRRFDVALQHGRRLVTDRLAGGTWHAALYGFVDTGHAFAQSGVGGPALAWRSLGGDGRWVAVIVCSGRLRRADGHAQGEAADRKSTRLNSSH